MAKPLLGTVWKVKEKTGNSPFGVNDTLTITGAGSTVNVAHHNSVTSVTKNHTGTYSSARNMVTGYSSIGDEYWEFMVSETVIVIIDPDGTRGPKSVLYGMSWKNSKPDAMGSWVCDPQT